VKGFPVAEQRGSAQYESSYRATLALAGAFPANRRSESGVCGSWSLKDLLGHLAFWDADLALELDARQSGERLPTSSERDWNAINTEQARLRADHDWEAIVAEVRANHDRLVPLLDNPGEFPDDDPIQEHWDEHRAQIENWLEAQRHPDSATTTEWARDMYLTLQQSTIELATGLPESMRDEPGVCGSWTLAELMSHLAFWDGVVADRLSARKSGKVWESDTRGYDVINAEASAARSDLTWDDIVGELVANRERLESLLLDPGEGDGFKIYTHWQAHGAEIEAWASEHSHV
jgi:hypothetical protein